MRFFVIATILCQDTLLEPDQPDKMCTILLLSGILNSVFTLSLPPAGASFFGAGEFILAPGAAYLEVR